MSIAEVSVAWDTPVVFAGQDIKCKITFRNTSAPVLQDDSKARGQDQASKASRLSALQQVASANGVRPRPSGSKRQVWTHRATSSFHIPDRLDDSEAAFPKPYKHKRSVSILSISSSPNTSREQAASRASREASTQAAGPGAEIPNNPPPFRSHSPTFAVSSGELTATELETRAPVTSSRFLRITEPGANLCQNSKSGRLRSHAAATGLEEEGASSKRALGATYKTLDGRLISNEATEAARARQGWKGSIDQMANMRPPLRTSGHGISLSTPRTSIDDDILSNHSSDTLASEYPSAFPPSRPPRMTERDSRIWPSFASNGAPKPETLMMGYVQLVGGFVIDGSLVNPAPFEQAKKRGVIGGQAGGGVVGVDHSNKNSGLLGSFGWPGLGHSIGSMLNGGDLSSFREMKGIADNQAIPIISTPQSVLFVNMTLHPGESKSFSYSHTLPRTIPPTYRGRTIRSSYHLLIGTQRQQSINYKPRVTHVEAPFRVLPSLNGSFIRTKADSKLTQMHRQQPRLGV